MLPEEDCYTPKPRVLQRNWEIRTFCTVWKWEINGNYHSGKKYFSFSLLALYIQRGICTHMCTHMQPDSLPSYACTVPIEARKPHTCIWGQNVDPTAAFFNVATLITELIDQCVQLKLWPHWAEDQPCCAASEKQAAVSKGNTPILKILICLFLHCTLASVPLPSSPKTPC